MSSLTIRDLINQIRTNDPELVYSSTSSIYSISAGNESNNTNTDGTSSSTSSSSEDDVTLLTTLLPTNTTLQKLSFAGPAPTDIRRDMLQELFETVLCHNSIRKVGLVRDILDVATANVLVDVLRTNAGVVITQLELYRNEGIMEVPGVLAILESLKYNRTVEHLDFGYSLQCFEDNASIEDQIQMGHTFRELLQVNTTLKRLDIEHNNLSATVSTGLIEGLRTNTTLDTIFYNENILQDSSAIELADVLRYNRTLTTLDVANNHIGDEGVIAIAETLRYWNKTLRFFYIYENDLITTVGYTALANMLKTNTSLRHLSIGGQPDELMSYIISFMDALQYNTTLKRLRITEPETSEQWNTVYDKVNEMMEYNDTITPFWYNWRPPPHLDANPWQVANEFNGPNNPPRHAPKKGSRQRSDTYYWLLHWWM